MHNHLKVLFLALALVSICNCDKYEDLEENVDSENFTSTTNDYKDITVKYETMINIENKTIHRKGLFDEEVVIFEKQTEKPKTDETKGTIIETARSWIRETTKHRDEIKEFCPHFKFGGDFEYNEMGDVWQVAYYQASDRVQCFKIHIKVVSDEEKNALATKYGSLSDKIKWKKCNLEIRSSAHMLRSHYLQGDNSDDGVMENVIILGASSDDKGDNEFTPSFRNEVPDQWLVFKNLLFMRDCETGGTVVFSRVPHQPTFGDILDGLKEFGEEDKNGRLACNDEEIIKPFDTDEDGGATFD